MISAIRAAIACVALLTGALAEENLQVVIDSHGDTLKTPVIRSAKIAKPHLVLEEGSVLAPRTALDRSDLKYNFVEEEVPGACHSHYQYQGLISNEECAARCYKTFGCTRFSAGGCNDGCRISVPNENNPNHVAVPADGQCTVSAQGDSATCIVYQLAFFHAIDQPGSCRYHYELHEDATNKAECAHACKNTEGCTKFSAEPNCQGGCRISKCNTNAGVNGTKFSACPADSQCSLSIESGCTVYSVFR